MLLPRHGWRVLVGLSHLVSLTLLTLARPINMLQGYWYNIGVSVLLMSTRT